jgi:glycosyltransferase involved in cell wall biosynthesis
MSTAAPLVSIITPTFERAQFLPFIAQGVLNQSFSDFEWLVLDDSARPSSFMQKLSDPRVIYEHIGQRTTIGKKRNRLVERARAKIIAQFDDDDFYARDYLAKMKAAMDDGDADIVKLFGFFLYSKLWKTFGYWDLTTKVGPHWVWSADPPNFVMLTPNNNIHFRESHLGFGFSYLFKKAVWEQGPFPDLNFNEDGTFVVDALKRFKLKGIQDDQCMSIHVLHQSNTSHCFPQFVLPGFLLSRLFPDAGGLLSV